jgi:hypothetical protein
MARFSRVIAHWQCALVCLPLLSSTLAAQAPGDDGRYVRLRIETDRATYRAGDSIAVRVAFTNTARGPIRYVPIPPWYSSRLRVTDDRGRIVPLTSEPTAFSMISTIRATLPGGVTRVRKSPSGGEWADLRRWGYSALRPGRYTIEGAPLINDLGVRADTTLRSNRVTITITP